MIKLASHWRWIFAFVSLRPILRPWLRYLNITQGVFCFDWFFFLKLKRKIFENEDRSTKHPNLENEDPKSRKRSTQNSKTKQPQTRKRRPLDRKRSTPKLENVVKRGVRVIRASLTLGFQPRFRPFVLLLTRTWIRQNLLTDSDEVYISMYVYRMHIKIRCIKYSETNNINTGYPF